MQKNPAPETSAIRVFVADSSRIHTQLLADALKRDPQLQVFPFESNSRGLVAAVVRQDIDVLVISPNLDEQPSRGFELLREVRAARDQIRAVVLLDSSKDEAVLNAFRAGARGVFSRNEPVEVLGRCIRCVHQGDVWANSHEVVLAVQALASAPAVRAVNANGLSLLSKRELQVVRSLAEGLTNREIAERLKLSQHTVKNYLFRVFDKLGVSSRVELLFMTLSRPGSEQPLMPNWPFGTESGNSPDELALFQKAAEAGLPAAQMALAQMYWARRADAQDLVHGYMWYLIAMQQASHATGAITKMLTAKQIEQAQEKASQWLSRTQSASPDLGTRDKSEPAPARR
jgi:two-component system, NarL family, nitrate/nitrite response regulator NarL